MKAVVSRAGTKTGADLFIQQVSLRYGSQQVLSDISLKIAPGETLALLGANGSGKSTLLKCLVRLAVPQAGSVVIDGTDVLNCPRRQLRHARSRIGIVFQKHNLVPRVSALSNVIHGCLGKTSDPRLWAQIFTPADIRYKAMECLDAVGMSHLAGRQANRLSGGESQRVAIARALMQDPALLLADEPAASLDPGTGIDVMELFRRAFPGQGKTLVFVSHDLDHALSFSDRIVGLKDGRIIIDTPTKETGKDELARLYR